MRHWLLVLICAFLNLTLAPVIVANAKGDRLDNMPRFVQDVPLPAPPVICLPTQIWNDQVVKPIHARPIYLGTSIDGGMVLIMVAPDKSLGVFNVTKEGTQVCLLAAAQGGEWDRDLLTRIIFGQPGFAI